MRITGVPFLAFILASSFALADEGHQHGGPAEKLGTVNFPTTCSAAAQKVFQQGVAMLHSFWYEGAERTFRSAAAADPKCSIVWWGVAMTHYHPLWPDAPTPAGLKSAAEALEKAQATPPRSRRERDYVATIAEFYRDQEHRDARTRKMAWVDSMRGLHQRYPKDIEASIFYALALNAAALPHNQHSLEYQKEAAGLLEPIFAAKPQHPGVAHLLIHSYDTPQMAQYGVKAARRYAAIAPSVPHALHMPSHIFTRLGLWEDSAKSNQASADAARDTRVKKNLPSALYEEFHALDYLMYAYMQTAQDTKAGEVVARASQLPLDAGWPLNATYAAAAIPARYALERHDWKAATELEPRESASLFGRAITYWAQAIGAARSGQNARTREAVGRLEQARDQLKAAGGDGYWAEQAEILRLEAAAVIAAISGDAGALGLMRKATEMEEATEKSPVTPGALTPAREMLANLELELNRPADALENYEAVLRLAPRRFNALYGAARAAEQAGETARAREFYSQLAEVARNADTERPELKQARTSLAQR